MSRRKRVAWALGLVAWALSLGPGCGTWTWSQQPLVIVTEDDCNGALALVEWSHGDGPNRVLADALAWGDCIEGFDRDRWHDLYLWCEAADPVDATSGLIVPTFGSRAERLRDACRRVVVASSP